MDQTLTHGVQAAKVWPSLGYDDLNLLGELSALMVVQVIRPLGELLTGLPVGRHAPEKTAGPSFMLTSATPVTPHKPAAWLILRERLLEPAEACDGLTADAPEVLARVRQQLGTFAARLGRPGAVGQEPQADVPARTIQPPAGDAPVPSFERDIRPLCRERDRAAMRWAFDLGKIASVRQHAEAILEQVTADGYRPVAQTRSLVFLRDGRLAALTDGAQERTPGIVVPLGGGGRRSSH